MSLHHNQPKGLFLLFFVEMWERFSYYGMRALLVLYMVDFLMFSTQKSGQVYGWYTGMVYLTPLIGGYIADRYLGQRACIVIGAVLMALQALGIVYAVSRFGHATAINITYSTRGIWSVALVWGLGHWFGSEERDHGHRVMAFRLTGASLLLVAVLLVML